jgi:hypothetical protein
MEPGRFGRMLADKGQRFASGFVERAQEAVRAYNAHAFLAACAMCGAAAESIILALAVVKTGDEKKILDQYVSGGGRGRLEKIILGGQPQLVQDECHRSGEVARLMDVPSPSVMPPRVDEDVKRTCRVRTPWPVPAPPGPCWHRTPEVTQLTT